MPPGKAIGAQGKTIGAVQHAIDVMRCLSEAQAPLGINELGRRLGLHKSSISRLVATLEQSRLVQRGPDAQGITLGIGLVVLAAPVLGRLGVTDVARPVLEALARASGETVSYSIWDGRQAVNVEQALGDSAVRTYAAPGKRNPGHSTAAGKMLLAHEPVEVIDACCARRLQRFTARTITDPARLRQELALTRARGYALNEGELESDVGAVSAAVRDRAGRVVGTVTATVPLYRFGVDRRGRLIELVVEAAAEISAKLGYAPGDGHLG